MRVIFVSYQSFHNLFSIFSLDFLLVWRIKLCFQILTPSGKRMNPTFRPSGLYQ